MAPIAASSPLLPAPGPERSTHVAVGHPAGHAAVWGQIAVDLRVVAAARHAVRVQRRQRARLHVEEAEPLTPT